MLDDDIDEMIDEEVADDADDEKHCDASELELESVDEDMIG
jgi:hypothetical protein